MSSSADSKIVFTVINIYNMMNKILKYSELLSPIKSPK